MDETGFRIGIGKDQVVVTKRKRAHYFGIPENRESATCIEAISAAGECCPAFIILTGQLHMAKWYRTAELDPRSRIATAPTGYSNDQLSFEWLKHFDEHSKRMQQGKKRLLILDGHGSHHTREFIQYCDDHGIVVFGLPPHLTHLLQPLDVVVFQPLKHYHAKALDVLVRDGLTEITKLEFLSVIEGVRKEAFKATTIKSAFKKTGIHPYNPDIVLRPLQERVIQHTPSPTRQTSSSSTPFQTPMNLRQINKAASDLTAIIDQNKALSPTFKRKVTNYIKGGQIAATELIRIKRDLGRTQYAETIKRQRRALKNRPLQSGGVLKVSHARPMVQKKEEDDIKQAREKVEKADSKAKNAAKNTLF